MQQFLERTEQLADKGEGFAKKVGNYMVHADALEGHGPPALPVHGPLGDTGRRGGVTTMIGNFR